MPRRGFGRTFVGNDADRAVAADRHPPARLPESPSIDAARVPPYTAWLNRMSSNDLGQAAGTLPVAPALLEARVHPAHRAGHQHLFLRPLLHRVRLSGRQPARMAGGVRPGWGRDLGTGGPFGAVETERPDAHQPRARFRSTAERAGRAEVFFKKNLFSVRFACSAVDPKKCPPHYRISTSAGARMVASPEGDGILICVTFQP
jgi:hypothetical protein